VKTQNIIAAKDIEKKVHQKQQLFFDDKARNRWIFGGNRTGKTHAGAVEAVRWLLEKNCEGWVISVSTRVQRDVAQRKVLALLDEAEAKYDCVMHSGRADNPVRGIIDFLVIKKDNGHESRLGFRNAEQGREKFQGTKLDFVWFDEEPDEEIYDECIMRTMGVEGAGIWGTMTPLRGRTWLYERIFLQSDKSEISVHQWSWEDNPFISKEEIGRMEKNFSTDILESRKFGRFSEGSGLVFSEFEDSNIVRLSNSVAEGGSDLETPCYRFASGFVYTGIAIDPGYTNPTAVLWIGIDGDENIFVIDEYKQSKTTVEQIVKVINTKSKNLGIPVRNVFIDSAAAADSFGSLASVANQFRLHGIDVNTNVNKSVLEGIHRMKALFKSDSGSRKLFIYENCVEIMREIRGYCWGDSNKPVKRNDHCIDALRYFVMAVSPGDSHEVSVSETTKPKRQTNFEKFKRRIINEARY